MGDRPIVYTTVESDLIDGSASGGLGILTSDIFLEALRRKFPLYLFSIEYPNKSCQRIGPNGIETKSEKTRNGLVPEYSSVLNTDWYPVKIDVCKHPLSTKSTKAYFVRMGSTQGNGWLSELELYNEKDYGQKAFIRKEYAVAILEFLEKKKMSPRVFHLNESDTGFLANKIRMNTSNDVRIVGHVHTPEHHFYKEFRRDDCGFCDEYNDDIVKIWKMLLDASDSICCVSKMHEDVMKGRHPEYSGKITHVTNGVYLSWINKHLRNLYDLYIQGWEDDVNLLGNLNNISDIELIDSHLLSKIDLQQQFDIWKKNGEVLSSFDRLEITKPIVTYAKRFTDYKRPDAVIEYIDRFPDVRFIFAGRLVGDFGEKRFRQLTDAIKNRKNVAYVLNYDRNKSRYLVSGSDVWLNIPIQAREASGTSGMKALLNGLVLVTTNGGFVPETVIDSNNGIVVDDNLIDLGQRLDEALEIARERLGEWMRRTISLSSPFVLMQRTFDEYISKLWQLNLI
jgi:glucan phosphorylase